MPRPGVTTDFATAVAAKVIRPCFFVNLTFKNETLYLWSGLNSVTWSGNVYYGAGPLLTMTGIGETSEVNAKNVTITVSGIPSEIISDALNEMQRGLPASIYFGLFEADGQTLVPSPVLAYVGRMDQPEISDGGDTCNIAINIENALVDMNRPIWRRYTDADQQMDYPGDLGCEFVPSIEEVQIYFGRLPQSTNN